MTKSSPRQNAAAVTTHEPPPGAPLHLGGQAFAAPGLQPLLRPISEVLPYPGNPRRHDQDNITGSIRDHGLYAAVVVQASTGYTLVGNGRRQALLDLGAERIPVIVQDVDDERARAIVARDNRTSDLSAYDDRLLLSLLEPMTEHADLLALAGYEDDDLEDLRRAIANHDFALEAGALTGAAGPLADHSPAIDVDGDAERVTVTVDAGHRQDLYTLLAKQPWVRDVADAHVRKPAAS